MFKRNEHYFYSPSDLACFMDSPFASWMDRFAIEVPDLAPAPDLESSLETALSEKGKLHELEFESQFREQGLIVERIRGESVQDQYKNTIQAMKNGIDIIVQGRLELDTFSGFSDFLVKIKGISDLGDYHYEVWDTKLGSKAKPTFIMQLCCYSEMLEKIQGRMPEMITLAFGKSQQNIPEKYIPEKHIPEKHISKKNSKQRGFAQKRFKIQDYFYYYLSLKSAFLDTQSRFDLKAVPNPATSTHWGRWSTYAEKTLIEQDHLFQIARITKNLRFNS